MPEPDSVPMTRIGRELSRNVSGAIRRAASSNASRAETQNGPVRGRGRCWCGAPPRT
ncbi:hypothetical protein PLANTIT3_60801 [Plantibacter sp. T3]|nr:hypothetical protein PLANTIT3_60801 [Plantibacter sp. T3]